jgi:hypothetical protein
LADLLSLPVVRTENHQRRLASVWQEALGEEVARHSQPRALRAGRVIAAASSSVWAQTLQLLSADLIPRLNAALGEELVREMVFRPAGWDPGGGAHGPRALGGEALSGRPQPPPVDKARRRRAGRRLSEEEERTLIEICELACDEELGKRIAGAMRASLRRQKGPSIGAPRGAAGNTAES